MTDRSALRPFVLAATLAAAGLLLAAALGVPAVAKTGRQSQPSPLHPAFPLLDDSGQPVLETGEPVSTMNTCGACHDAAFIEEHSFHAQAGLDQLYGEGHRFDIRDGDDGGVCVSIIIPFRPAGQGSR